MRAILGYKPLAKLKIDEIQGEQIAAFVRIASVSAFRSAISTTQCALSDESCD